MIDFALRNILLTSYCCLINYVILQITAKNTTERYQEYSVHGIHFYFCSLNHFVNTQGICKCRVFYGKTYKLIETRQFRHFNSTDFENNFREAFSNFNHYTDPNLAWHQWKGIFLQIADKHAPLRLGKVKSEYTHG